MVNDSQKKKKTKQKSKKRQKKEYEFPHGTQSQDVAAHNQDVQGIQHEEKIENDEAKARKEKNKRRKVSDDVPYNPYPCASKHIALKKRIFVDGDQAVSRFENLQNLASTLLDLAAAACRTFAAGTSA